MKSILLSTIILASATIFGGCGSNCAKKADSAIVAIEAQATHLADSLLEQITTPPITAVFNGSDGKTKRLYKVTVVFYPDHERATLTDDERTYQLKQYVTGSGYGYSSHEIDLRGKGTEATLTYTNGPEIKLTQEPSTNNN